MRRSWLLDIILALALSILGGAIVYHRVMYHPASARLATVRLIDRLIHDHPVADTR
jgi:hypothetical protein